MSLLPSNLKDIYYQFADELLENEMLSNTATLYYPPKRENCPNCIVSGFGGGGSINIGRHGGPLPVGISGSCNICGGVGYKEIEITEQIRLRTYLDKSSWRKMLVQIPDVDLMTIGFMSDINKIQKCAFIEIIDKQSGNVKLRFELEGLPQPHGFFKERYFLSWWKKI